MIKVLANHMGSDLTDDKIHEICNNLFGDSPTFREGKIGSWKKYFSPHHKKIFKERMGKELIQLGYADDFEW